MAMFYRPLMYNEKIIYVTVHVHLSSFSERMINLLLPEGVLHVRDMTVTRLPSEVQELVFSTYRCSKC